MTPTPYLRFVERQVPIGGTSSKGVRVLQQWWTTGDYIPIEGAPDGCIGEWRDVEMVQP